MDKYRVRRPEHGEEWEDARVVSATDTLSVAEEYAERQCSEDPECYRSYESGVFLEVQHVESGEVVDVSVTVSFDPSFYARVQKSRVTEQRGS